MIIRTARAEDARAVVEIYNHYVLTTAITFEEQAVAEADMATRMREVDDAGLPWLVAEVDGAIVGFAYAGKWKQRSAYRYSAESTVYIAHDKRAKGGVRQRAGRRLIERLKSAGYHTLIGGIVDPNEASVRLHERFGFVKTAVFREVGFKFGRWHDVGYWQRSLE